VCHSPVPLYPVGAVNRAAEDAGLDLQWDPKNMSCIGTKRLFTDVLKEIKGWMMQEENLEEIVMIYIDTKIFLPNSEQITKGTQDIWDVFGDMTYSIATDGSPLYKSRRDLLNAGKRILFENQKDIWLQTEGSVTPVVISPVLWTHQFDENSFQEFPNCTIEGDSEWYGSQMVRALSLSGIMESASRCGVNLISPDYINPDEMKMYVWSWDQMEPASLTDCVAMLPSGRWGTLPCDTALPYACADDKGVWSVNLDVTGAWAGDKAVCNPGFAPSVPHNGFTNAKLNLAGYGQTIWLNTLPQL